MMKNRYRKGKKEKWVIKVKIYLKLEWENEENGKMIKIGIGEKRRENMREKWIKERMRE